MTSKKVELDALSLAWNFFSVSVLEFVSNEGSGDAVYKHSLHCFLLERSIKIWQKWKIPPNIPYNRNSIVSLNNAGIFHSALMG